MTDDAYDLDDEPHKICTPEEYFFMYRPNGKHAVCFDYDSAGGVAIWYMSPKKQEDKP